MKDVYIRDEDYSYEVETTYQLEYYISAALISIDCIQNPVEEMTKKFLNRVQYYHYYVDNLFRFLGLINDRFIYKKVKNDEYLAEEKKSRVESNKRNYLFDEQKFAILSKKMPRNIIEHLDERNLKTVQEERGVGGFNVIFIDSSPEMVKSIKKNVKLYPYYLDLVEGKVVFYNIQAGQEKEKMLEVSIDKVQEELELLGQNVKSFADIMKM